MIKKICGLTLLSGCLLAQAAFGRQYAVLNIKAADSNGDQIDNVTLRLKRKDKIIRETESSRLPTLKFSGLKIGSYLLEADAEGFERLIRRIEIKSGNNEVHLIMKVRGVNERVDIQLDPQEKSIDEVLGGFYTRKQINELPNKSADIERELKRRYGQDVVIIVDGFSNRIPNKPLIASIRVSQSSYDAENHKIGLTYVRISTKVSEQSFRGSIGFDFDDESLNARNPLSTNRLPEQSRDMDFSLIGPLVNEKASFFLSALHNTNTKRENIIAILPEGNVNSSVDANAQMSSINADVITNLPQNHTARFSYVYDRAKNKNLGVGGFNLPERAFTTINQKHFFRVSESGYIKNRFFNEFRFEFRKVNLSTSPESQEVAINVLDSFNSGSAGNLENNDHFNLSVGDNLLYGIKKHAVKLGVLLEFEKINTLSEFNKNGAYIFPSLNDFILKKPSLFTQQHGSRNVNVAQTKIGLFLQDDFRIRKSFGLSFGVRYEWQNNVADINNFSPRFSFVWSPFKHGRVTLRAGVGIFYDWLEADIISFIRTRSIGQPNETVFINPGFPNPFSAGDLSTQSRVNYWQLDANLRNPYIIHSSFVFNWQVLKQHKLRGEYVYQKSVRQFRTRNINAPKNGIRPNPELGNVNQFESSGLFVRNSLRLRASGILPKGFSYSVSYTLSKTISDTNGIFGLPSDNYNLALDRSFANNDQRHRFSTSIHWELKKGLSLAAIYNVGSAFPYTITTGTDDNGDTVFNDRSSGVRRNSERGASNSQLDVGASWSFSFINFKGKKKGLQSTTFKPGEIAQTFGLTDENKRFSLKLYISARNVLNQTNLRRFVGVRTSPLFKQAIEANQPRRLEMGMRFNF